MDNFDNNNEHQNMEQGGTPFSQQFGEYGSGLGEGFDQVSSNFTYDKNGVGHPKYDLPYHRGENWFKRIKSNPTVGTVFGLIFNRKVITTAVVVLAYGAKIIIPMLPEHSSSGSYDDNIVSNQAMHSQERWDEMVNRVENLPIQEQWKNEEEQEKLDKECRDYILAREHLLSKLPESQEVTEAGVINQYGYDIHAGVLLKDFSIPGLTVYPVAANELMCICNVYMDAEQDGENPYFIGMMYFMASQIDTLGSESVSVTSTDPEQRWEEAVTQCGDYYMSQYTTWHEEIDGIDVYHDAKTKYGFAVDMPEEDISSIAEAEGIIMVVNPDVYGSEAVYSYVEGHYTYNLHVKYGMIQSIEVVTLQTDTE